MSHVKTTSSDLSLPYQEYYEEKSKAANRDVFSPHGSRPSRGPSFGSLGSRSAGIQSREELGEGLDRGSELENEPVN
ncbi:hypothetical protein Acr_15g0007990 [Actinidia rufa]|uniref:Uncharacterized protein n=1 Tax=Actinidia rufa TaxID=165716 RepID=A0A7J0FVG3_9ERIC|nr:hypothetical protein Acr_15g0007990 [Actinidia rufa]